MIARSDALFYHAELVNKFGGSHGVRDEGILDASLNRPFATFGGIDLFPEPVDKAAAIMHGIITGHPFIDGNEYHFAIEGRPKMRRYFFAGRFEEGAA